MALRMRLKSFAELAGAMEQIVPIKAPPVVPERRPMMDKDSPPLSVPTKVEAVESMALATVVRSFLTDNNATVSDLARVMWNITPTHSIWRSRTARIRTWLEGKSKPDAVDQKLLHNAISNWSNPVIAKKIKEQPAAALPPKIVATDPIILAPNVESMTFLTNDVRIDLFHDLTKDNYNLVISDINMTVALEIIKYVNNS